jgi:hypothetical protein
MIKPHLLVSSSLRVRISLHMFSRPCRTGFVIAVILVFDTSVHRVVADPPAVSTKLSADQAAAIDRITSDSLRGHLSFLASDLLEGRDTPSRGLDLAAEYIAAQFRRAGLEAIGDDG